MKLLALLLGLSALAITSAQTPRVINIAAARFNEPLSATLWNYAETRFVNQYDDPRESRRIEGGLEVCLRSATPLLKSAPPIACLSHTCSRCFPLESDSRLTCWPTYHTCTHLPSPFSSAFTIWAAPELAVLCFSNWFPASQWSMWKFLTMVTTPNIW